MRRTLASPPVTSLALSSSSPSGLRVDALVVGVAQAPEGDTGPRRGRRRATSTGSGSRRQPLLLLPGAADLDKAFKGQLLATVAALGGTGKAGEVVKLPSGGATKAPVVVVVGVGALDRASDAGRDGGLDLETLRRAAGAAARALAGTTHVGLALPTESTEQVAAAAEGALLGAYAFHRFRSATRGEQDEPVEEFTLVVPSTRDKAARAAVERAHALATAVHLARDLVNTPPSHLHPAELADAAVAAVADLPVEATVLDEEALRVGGYGGTLAVGQGSANPPRLVRLSYRPKKAKAHLALVGKGITFDSGGLSLKPAQAMEWMKADMGGAAAVLATVAAVARLGLDVAVTAWAPMAENMPSGTAQRPSDVITIYGGRTVEVMNTDAEGRLVLADGIVAACADAPDVLVDVATLTGAQLVALGSRTAGIMANDDALRDQVHALGRDAGEQLWPMPLPEELRKSLDSEVADISNMGDRYGGMLVAGLFLKEFVPDGTRWAHLDVAGPAWNEGDPYGYTPKGGTGAAVRTLVRLAEDLAAR
jgi:leucyl aminopeptidase